MLVFETTALLNLSMRLIDRADAQNDPRLCFGIHGFDNHVRSGHDLFYILA